MFRIFALFFLCLCLSRSNGFFERDLNDAFDQSDDSVDEDEGYRVRPTPIFVPTRKYISDSSSSSKSKSKSSSDSDEIDDIVPRKISKSTSSSSDSSSSSEKSSSSEQAWDELSDAIEKSRKSTMLSMKTENTCRQLYQWFFGSWRGLITVASCVLIILMVIMMITMVWVRRSSKERQLLARQRFLENLRHGITGNSNKIPYNRLATDDDDSMPVAV